MQATGWAADIRNTMIILLRRAPLSPGEPRWGSHPSCSPPRVRSRWSRPWALLGNFFEVRKRRNKNGRTTESLFISPPPLPRSTTGVPGAREKGESHQVKTALILDAQNCFGRRQAHFRIFVADEAAQFAYGGLRGRAHLCEHLACGANDARIAVAQ